MVRLVFRPYTQVGRPICTSGPLRASTRVSSGFALPRHSSPSFGSYRARSRSTSPTLRARRAGGAPGPRRGPGSHLGRRWRAGPHFHCATGFRNRPLTRARVRLLGPCYKTGRVGSRHRRRPLAPLTWAGPRPGGAARSGRTEDSPHPVDSRAGGEGAPSLRAERTAGERGRSEHSVPRPRRAATSGRRGAVKLAAEAASHLRPRALPGRSGAGRGAPPRRKCARRGQAGAGERSREGILPHRAGVPYPPG